MTLRIVGAGVGRTGTMSLKLALEKLIGAPCYHMLEVFGHPEHVPLWDQAMHDDFDDWDSLFEGYGAAVDWPVCTFWLELSEKYPEAPVLLSTRDPESWWTSCDRTIFNVFRGAREGTPDEWLRMATAMLERFTPNFLDAGEAKKAFVRHNDEVRSTVPPSRLVEWRPGDDWAPLCEALGVPVPEEPYPHENTAEQFRQRAGMDE